MAAMSTSKTASSSSLNCIRIDDNVILRKNLDHGLQEVSIYDIFFTIISLITIVIDCCTDIFLAIEYYQYGHKQWAWIAFSLIFVPSLIVQLISLRWHISDNGGSVSSFVFHCCCLGLFHRYYTTLLLGLDARRLKQSTSYQKVFSAQSELSLLHLFESFLESAPQLVLQLYVIAKMKELKVFAGFSAAASVFSLSLSLVTYSRAQRRAFKNQRLNLPSLALQVFWRLGMLTARICSLVLLILCFQGWFLLFIGVHWLSMFLWILYQNTDLCDTNLEERCYNAVAAAIYCFCFFNLKEGRSRWRVLFFYALLLLQNLTSLTVFLMWHSDDTPILDVIAFVAVVGGTIIGFTCMSLYYRFFHPSAPVSFCNNEDPKPSAPALSYDSLNMRSLKRPRRTGDIPCSIATVSTNDIQRIDSNLSLSNSKLVLSDSVVIVEESDMEEINTLQTWLKEAVMEEQLKRQGVCSPLDFDDVASSILSAHDYENLAAVNIARAGGLRHWRGYCDIETYLHDDSIVRDTLTSTTGSSSQDYLDAIIEDYQDCKLSADPVGMFAPSSLDTILEEVESICSDQSRTRGPCTLVATIDQIRITTPVQEERPRGGVRRKFSLIREKFETRKDSPNLSVPTRERAQSPLKVSVKEMRAFFLRQVLTPPKLAALRNKVSSPSP